MDLTQAKFLLDENIPRKLKKVFKSKGLDCQTVQELGWREVKNGGGRKNIMEKGITVHQQNVFYLPEQSSKKISVNL